MGMVSVDITGSFGNKGKVHFSAEEGGHAYALTRAIAYLVTQMAGAIVKDHELHDAGDYPQTAFGTSGAKELAKATGVKYCEHGKDKRFCDLCKDLPCANFAAPPLADNGGVLSADEVREELNKCFHCGHPKDMHEGE